MEQIVYSTHHYDRCRDVCLKDPVHTIVLRDYLESQVTVGPHILCFFPDNSDRFPFSFQLKQTKSQLGERFDTLKAMIDEQIMQNLDEFDIHIQ